MEERVLFVCTHNSARSQMAEGLLNAMYGDRYQAFSAGTNPTEVNPYVVEVMSELGIDLSTHRAKSIQEFQEIDFDYVVTVCDTAKEACPFFPGENVIHKGFSDPSQFEGSQESVLKNTRQVRDAIKAWLKKTFGDKVKPGKSPE